MNMMKRLRFFYCALIFSLTLLNVSCRKEKKTASAAIVQETPSRYTWYYFSENTYKKAEKLPLVPASTSKPWTEAVRISSCGLEDSKTTENPKGFATVNQLGMLVFQGDKINFVNDSEIFKGRTAGNLVFAGEVPVFSVYKSTFFNESISAYQKTHPFLVQFNSEQNVFYPMINIENLGLDESSEITDFVFDGQFWTCSIKKNSAEKVDFSYLTFQSKEDITLLTPYNAQRMLHISETSVDSFRNARKPLDFTAAPERLKKLLTTVPSDIEFSVSVQTVQSHSPRIFSRTKKSSSGQEMLSAKALISDTWIACLFEDGTMYLNGALFEKNILNGGKTMGIKLPKLPVNFVYGDFVITGTTLYASWEETAFYKTKRSGFISVNLDEVLYRR